MNYKKIIIFVVTLLVLFGLAFYIKIVGFKDSKLPLINTDLEIIGKDEPKVPKTVQKLDITNWSPVQIHLDVMMEIPKNWNETSDGIYNYDQTTVTGIRDPNFPDNSFKCVFFDAKGESNFYDVLEEEIIATTPQIKFLKIKWNENQEASPARAPGDETQIYLIDLPTRSQIQVECVVFKGLMTQDDRNILENILLTLR